MGNSNSSVSSNPCCAELDRAGGGFGRALWLVEGPRVGRLDGIVSRHHHPHQRYRFSIAAVRARSPRMVGILSLVLLAVALLAIYVFRVSGPWRWIYVVAAMIALYLDAFVGVIQAFAKLSFLHELAPTGSEPPFVIVQVVVLAIFVVLGFLAARRFHPKPANL